MGLRQVLPVQTNNTFFTLTKVRPGLRSRGEQDAVGGQFVKENW
jgi:hypothetical protein